MTMFIYGGGGPKMFLKPVPKGHLQFSNVILFITCMGTFKPVNYSTLLGDGILILGGYEKVMAGIVSLEENLYCHFITHLNITFAEYLSIGYH